MSFCLGTVLSTNLLQGFHQKCHLYNFFDVVFLINFDTLVMWEFLFHVSFLLRTEISTTCSSHLTRNSVFSFFLIIFLKNWDDLTKRKFGLLVSCRSRTESFTTCCSHLSTFQFSIRFSMNWDQMVYKEYAFFVSFLLENWTFHQIL